MSLQNCQYLTLLIFHTALTYEKGSNERPRIPSLPHPSVVNISFITESKSSLSVIVLSMSLQNCQYLTLLIFHTALTYEKDSNERPRIPSLPHPSVVNISFITESKSSLSVIVLSMSLQNCQSLTLLIFHTALIYWKQQAFTFKSFSKNQNLQSLHSGIVACD
jgi:hypothetical protein